jgi:hypothetical protein
VLAAGAVGCQAEVCQRLPTSANVKLENPFQNPFGSNSAMHTLASFSPGCLALSHLSNPAAPCSYARVHTHVSLAAAAAAGKWVLIDFGLARKYVGEDGSHMPPRSDASFRGSTTYASVHAHRNEDLSRRDDLWSWFYMLTELVEGEADSYSSRHVLGVLWGVGWGCGCGQ